MSRNFVPATGFARFLPCFDTLVRLFAFQPTYIRHALEQAAACPASTVLDVGCGTGTLAISLARQAQHIHVRALDIDQKILDQASQKAGGLQSIEWLLGSATRLPLPDASIGLVTCSLVLHHLTRREKRLALREIGRVLAPGGRLLLIDYCKPQNWLATLQFLPVRMVDGWERTRCNVSGQLPDLQSHAGLVDIQETLMLGTPLGTIRCYRSHKPLQ